MIGARALVRWRHLLELGMISRLSSSPVFEKNGFIYSLDMYVCVERLCEILEDGKRPVCTEFL